MLSPSGKINWKKRLAERLYFAPTVFGKLVATATDAPAEVLLIELSRGRKINKIISTTETFWRGSPVVFDHLIVLNNSEGFSVYSNNGCSAQILRRDGEKILRLS